MSKKIILLFPGQGSQYIGMGSKENSKYFDIANKVLNYDLKNIINNGPNELLALTQNTQPAIVAYSITLLNILLPILKKYNLKIDKVIGHSVGEYSALVAAESLSLEDAIKAVHSRGKFMQQAVPKGIGAMVAILKIPADTIKDICSKVSDDKDKVMPANFNEPNQTVISGTKIACNRVLTWLEENYKETYRAIELNVSAPFHSSLMRPAAKQLEKVLNEINLKENKIDYIANIDANVYHSKTNIDKIKENLINQVDGSVLWSQSFASLDDDSICFEVGPGKTLMGLGRKINRRIKVYPLDGLENIDSVLENL